MSVRGWRLESAAVEAFRAERQRLRSVPAGPPRTPVLTVVGRLAARMVARVAARLPGVRTVVLTVGGLACLTAAAWTVAATLGLAVAGVSLLVLEWLSSDGGGRR